jgi:23S rRNA (uridine2552-2'-O)-methyltransferase
MKGRPDHFSRRARAEGYDARSVYKLSAVDERHRLLRRGLRVVEIGASPGSWSKYTVEQIGPEGSLVAADIAPLRTALPANARALLLDCLAADAAARLGEFGPYDLLLSDMAPRTTGVPFADHHRSAELARAALALANALVKPGGAAFVKVFDGEELAALRREFAACFQTTTVEKPEASRSDSVEVFLLGKKRIAAPPRAESSSESRR